MRLLSRMRKFLASRGPQILCSKENEPVKGSWDPSLAPSKQMVYFLDGKENQFSIQNAYVKDA